jgi:hypothetical protein
MVFPPERIICLTEETVETLYLLEEVIYISDGKMHDVKVLDLLQINAIIVICLLYASAHLALFPAYEDRFFAFPASLLFLSLIVLLFYGGSASPARQVRRVKALSSV